jgi:hypothetical protein
MVFIASPLRTKLEENVSAGNGPACKNADKRGHLSDLATKHIVSVIPASQFRSLYAAAKYFGTSKHKGLANQIHQSLCKIIVQAAVANEQPIWLHAAILNLFRGLASSE